MAFRSNLHFAESPRHSPAPPVSPVRQQCSAENIAVSHGAIGATVRSERACAAAFARSTARPRTRLTTISGKRLSRSPARSVAVFWPRGSAKWRAAPAEGMHRYTVPGPSAGMQLKQTQMTKIAMRNLPISHLAAPPLLHVEMSGRGQCHPSKLRLQAGYRGPMPARDYLISSGV